MVGGAMLRALLWLAVLHVGCGVIPRFATTLSGPPPVLQPELDGTYTVWMNEFFAQMLPPSFPATRVWGYAGRVKDAVTGADLGFVQGVPGPTIEATLNTGIYVRFINNISSPELFLVDPTLHWANPTGMARPTAPFASDGYAAAQSPVPLVPHLHGAELASASDGHPEAWFTASGVHGPAYATAAAAAANEAVYFYPNEQSPATTWYHDHALGLTRIHVMAGLAAFYIVRSASDTVAALLPSGKHDVPLLLQDRMFNETDGSMLFSSAGDNPTRHPYWRSHFMGNVICVNGLAWPDMVVDRGQYQLRLLNGANARFFDLRFAVGDDTNTLLPLQIVARDGGYLRASASATSVVLGPAQRVTVLVDFSALSAGTVVTLRNTAPIPYPVGDPVGAQTTAYVMRFSVGATAGAAPQVLPALLNPALATYPSLPASDVTVARTHVLYGLDDAVTGLPDAHLLNGQHWMAPASEVVLLNSTEDWSLVNLTPDTHPIHLHLVQFQLVRHQALDAGAYRAAWLAANGVPPYAGAAVSALDPTPYLSGAAAAPAAHEQGWHDTVAVQPAEVLTIRARFAPFSGASGFSFDATSGPGYVWHCHILDHEDNDMMRPLLVTANASLVVRAPVAAPATTTTQSAPSTGARACNTTTITMSGSAFLPSGTVDVFAGDTVVFVWAGVTQHQIFSSASATSCTSTGVFTSGGPYTSGHTWSLPITSANGFTGLGTYYFYCNIHCQLGMRGALRVVGTCGAPSAQTTATTTATTKPAEAPRVGMHAIVATLLLLLALAA